MIESARSASPLSRALLALDLRDGPVFEPSTGLIVARSGQRFGWSRSTTLASVPVTGGSYTAVATLPAWELANDALALRLSANDVLRESVAVGIVPQTLSGEFCFIERGARAGTAGGTLMALAGDDPTTGVRFYIDTTSSLYRITAHNGTDSATVTLPSGSPASGDVVRHRFEWSASSLLIKQSVNNGAFVSGQTAGVALPTAYDATTKWRIGRRGSTQNPAALSLCWLFVTPGELDDAALDEIY